MKKLLISLLALGSISSFAGTLGLPEQDPVVANLRDRFHNGTAPQENDLLDKSFKCKEMSAQKDIFRKIDLTNEIDFSSFDGFLVLNAKETAANGTHLVNNGTEMIGATYAGNYLSFRMDENGFLIGEWLITPVSENTTTLEPQSHGISKNFKVSTYLICVQK